MPQAPAHESWRHRDFAVPACSGPLPILSRWVTTLVFAAAAVCAFVFSLHWRMAIDTPVMHYVVFLLHHGLKPYSEITDNNLPGAYLSEAAGMAVFGWSDRAWRVYEFFLMAVLAASAILVTRRRDWAAGVFAAGLFLVLHIADGPQVAVERDLVIGVLLMAACALLFESVDRGLPALCLPFGLAGGLAASIKPTVLPLPLALLLVASLHLRRRQRPVVPTLLYATAGLLLAMLAVLAFLLRFHAFHGLMFVLLRVVPAYRDLYRMPLHQLLPALMPRAFRALTLLALPLALHSFRRGAWDWRFGCVALCAAFGLLSYLAQGKGYVYHRYVFLLFLLVLIATEIFTNLAQHGWPRWLAAAALLLGFATVPGHLHTVYAVVGQSSLELTLEQDLSQLGSRQQLEGNVQCFDLVYGCLDALYHLDLVENSAFTGDMLLFQTPPTFASEFYRKRFWSLATQHPAKVLVISNGTIGQKNSFDRLQQWPQFEAYLNTHYTEVLERRFPHEKFGVRTRDNLPLEDQDAYRIYLLNATADKTNHRLALP